MRKIAVVATLCACLGLAVLCDPTVGAQQVQPARHDTSINPQLVSSVHAVREQVASDAWYRTVAEDAWYQAVSRPVKTKTSAVFRKTSGAVVYGTGACGGDLPPCWVMMRESGGNLNAYNPTGCGGRGCYGKWQCDPRTCSGRGTEAQQDAEARALWDGGRGCANWGAC